MATLAKYKSWKVNMDSSWDLKESLSFCVRFIVIMVIGDMVP